MRVNKKINKIEIKKSNCFERTLILNNSFFVLFKTLKQLNYSFFKIYAKQIYKKIPTSIIMFEHPFASE
jgi:hypothetical protein